MLSALRCVMASCLLQSGLVFRKEHIMAAGSSWAQVAESEPPKAQTPQHTCTVTAQPTAVVDANAIVSGVQLVGLTERLVTIPEVQFCFMLALQRAAAAASAHPSQLLITEQ